MHKYFLQMQSKRKKSEKMTLFFLGNERVSIQYK